MAVAGEPIKTLHDLPINISGEWIVNQNYKWKGKAVSPEAIVAIVFLKHDNITEWCKSSIGSSNSLEIELWLSRYNKTDFQSQVGLLVGKGDRRYTSVLKSADYKPNIKAELLGKTGEIMTFTEVEGLPNICFELIFIARSDVKFGRNSIWYLRENINVSLPSKVKSILEKGRTGQFFDDVLI